VLSWIGHFRETSDGGDAPSIQEDIGQLPMTVRETVASYLEAGIMIGAVPGLARDVLVGFDIKAASPA
jgi:hypothetical protein